MSYDKNFSRGGRGRGGFNDNSSRPYNKYEDRSPKNDFPDRGFRGSRRPVGNYTKSYNREEYRPREDRRNSRDSYEREIYRSKDSRRDNHDSFRDRERNFNPIRRSPPDYRKEASRARPISPPRKEYHVRDIDPRIRDFVPRSRNFEIRRDYSPIARERHVSPVRYVRDRYEASPQRTFDRESFSDRRRTDFRTSNQRETREYRSRSPNIHQRGGRFNGQRGGRGRDNFNRFESDQRSSFNRQRDEPSIRGRMPENTKRKVDAVQNGAISMAKKSRDSS